MPRRPAKRFMQRCTRDVGTSARDPGAVCAARWHRMSPSAKRAWMSFVEAKRRNAKPGYAHLKPPSRGYGAKLPSELRRARGPALGSRVTLDLKPAHRGVFSITKVLSGGRFHVRRSDGLVLNVPRSAMRSAGNPWPVELHAVTYREQKPGDKRPELYEHEFEGRKPRLAYDGRDLKIRRGSSRYTVRKGWIHG